MGRNYCWCFTRLNVHLNDRTLLFNLYLNDIFFFENRSFVCGYADDNVLYAFGWDLNKVKEDLNQVLLKLPEWFYENCMIWNWAIVSWIRCREWFATILQKGWTWWKKLVNLKLEIKIDNKLNFEHHIKTLFNKLSQILGALQKILNFLDAEKNPS